MHILKAFNFRNLHNFRTWVDNRVDTLVSGKISIYQGAYATIHVGSFAAWSHGFSTNPHLFGIDVKCIATGGSDGHVLNAILKYQGSAVDTTKSNLTNIPMSPMIALQTSTQIGVWLPTEWRISTSNSYDAALTAANWQYRAWGIRFIL